MQSIMHDRSSMSTTFSYPVKHWRKVSYPRAMTVCIAAVNQEAGGSHIILCSDSRIDYGALGSTNTAVKVDVLGHGWCIQVAGAWSGVNYLCSLLKERIQQRNHPFDSPAQVYETAQQALHDFVLSPTYDRREVYNALLSGFFSRTPSIIEASIYKGKQRIDAHDPFCAVGFGELIATDILTLREYHARMPLNYATYLIYEAKRASEKTGRVGKFTVLLQQAPDVQDHKNKATLRKVSSVGIANLDSIYRGVWKVPFVDMPDFPDEFFEKFETVENKND